MIITCIIIGLAAIAGVLFWGQVRENRELRIQLDTCDAIDRPSRMIFLTKDENSKYMGKLVRLSIKAHRDAQAKIKLNSSRADKGYMMTLWENGDVLILQSLDKGELEKLENLDFYDNYVFVDYKIAPELVLKMLEDAGLRNFVYRFSIIDEKGV